MIRGLDKAESFDGFALKKRVLSEDVFIMKCSNVPLNQHTDEQAEGVLPLLSLESCLSK